MLRGYCVLLLVAAIAVLVHAGVSRADFEADLLKKFQSQNNKAAADKKRSEAPAAKAAPSQSAAAAPAKVGATDGVKGPAGATSADEPKVKVGASVIVVTNAGAIRVPDGGAAVLGSYKYLSEARNEGGVPFVGKLPYLGRAFRNVGYGKSAGNVQTSISVRIINLAEEDARLLGRK